MLFPPQQIETNLILPVSSRRK